MPIKLLDSTLVSLTMSVYNWEHNTTKNDAVKIHTLLDCDCLLPEFVNITTGKTRDNKVTYDIPIVTHNIVVEDSTYYDYKLLKHWECNKVFFVVRHRKNIRYTGIEERGLPEKHVQNILIEGIMEFQPSSAKGTYSKRIQRIAV